MAQPEDLRKLMDDHKLSPNKIALIAGVSERTARAWIADKRTTHFRPCPKDAWEKIRQSVIE